MTHVDEKWIKHHEYMIYKYIYCVFNGSANVHLTQLQGLMRILYSIDGI